MAVRIGGPFPAFPLVVFMKWLVLAPIIFVLQPSREVLVIPISGPINYAQWAFVQRIAEEARQIRPRLVIVEIDTPGGDVLSTLGIVDELLSLKRQNIEPRAFIRSIPGSSMAGSAFSAGSFIAIACKRIYMAPATVIGAAQPVMQTPEGVQAAEGKTVSALKKKVAAVAEENGYPVELVIAMVDPDFEVYVVDKNRFLTRPEPGAVRITKPGEPLTLTVREAVDYGLARAAAGREELLRREGIENASIRETSFSWSERLVTILTAPGVAILLLLVGLAALYMELQTPGFGVPGAIGLACLGLVMFGHYLAGLAQVPELLLVFVGILLLGIEIFILPGFGVAGIAGIVSILVGFILAFVPFSVPDFGDIFEISALLRATARVMVSVLASLALFLVILRFLPQVPIANRLVLETSLGETDWPTPPPQGAKGSTVTALVPGGKAEIGGMILDVVSEGEFIARGESIRVVAVEGSRVVVRRS